MATVMSVVVLGAMGITGTLSRPPNWLPDAN